MIQVGYRFRKSHRLRKRPEFLNLARYGRKCENRYFIIRYAANSRGNARLGVTVTRRIGGAVTRNRLKRRLREFFRIHPPETLRGIDLNIIVKKGAAALTTQQIFNALETLFHEISSGRDHA